MRAHACAPLCLWASGAVYTRVRRCARGGAPWVSVSVRTGGTAGLARVGVRRAINTHAVDVCVHGVRVRVGACPHAGRAPSAPDPGAAPPPAAGVPRGGSPRAQRSPCPGGSGGTPPPRSPPPPPGRSPPAAPPAAAHHLKPPRCRVRAGGGGAGPRRGVTASPGWRRCPPRGGGHGGTPARITGVSGGGHDTPPPLAVPQFPLCAPAMLRAKGRAGEGATPLAPRSTAGGRAPPSPTAPCPWDKHTHTQGSPPPPDVVLPVLRVKAPGPQRVPLPVGLEHRFVRGVWVKG